MTRFYGKYRGTVVNNFDPLQIGRVQVSCPAVLGENMLGWAMPCAPFGGPMSGFFAVPSIGSPIWVEFEAGDPDKPIWVGVFWTTGQAPALPALPTTKVWKTDGCTVKLDDLPGAGGITLEVLPPVVAVPVRFVMNAAGIELSCGAAKVALTPAMVSINNGALDVI